MCNEESMAEHLLDHPEETENITQWVYEALYVPELKDDIYKSMPSVEITKSSWETRKKSNLIKWLLEKSDVDLENVASHLGYTTTYLNNKLFRNSFSFENILKVAELCGFTLILSSTDGEVKRRLKSNDF